MPDVPDYRTPSRDAGHEAIRVPLAQAVDDIAAHVESLADAFLLAQTAGDGLDIALSNFLALQGALTQMQGAATTQAQAITDLQTSVTGLQQRVTALEAAQPTPTTPTTGGTP